MSRLPRQCRFGLLLALCPLLAASAAAQSSVAAEALFRAGRDASARGDHATACVKYRESYRIENALGTLLNIGVCEEALGQLASAWQRYQEVVHALEPDDSRVELARERLRALEPRVPLLTVELAEGAPADARVEIGTVQLAEASFRTPLPWDPGEHDLRVLAEGRAPRSYPFALAEGEKRLLVVDVGEVLEAPDAALVVAPAAIERPPEVASAPARPAPQEPTVDPTRLVLSYGALAIGAGGLVVSAVGLAVVLDQKAVVDDHCRSRVCDGTGIRAGELGRSWVTISWIGLAVGAVGTALGVYGLWATPDRDANTKAGVVRASASGVSVDF